MSNATETDLVRRIMLALGKFPGVRVFRNNTASGWAGQSKQQGPNRLVFNAFPLQAGLCKGSSDIIGFHSVTVTPEMVGKTVAIFAAVEVKTPTGRATPEQENFIAQINAFGGIAFVARSEEEAEELFKKAGK